MEAICFSQSGFKPSRRSALRCRRSSKPLQVRNFHGALTGEGLDVTNIAMLTPPPGTSGRTCSLLFYL